MIRKFFRKLKKENAQGTVEFALVLPILLLVVIGIMEMGRLLFVYSSVVSASREGARYAAAVGEYSGVPRYQDCDGIRDAALKAGSFAGLEDADIEIYYDDGITTTAATCPPTGRVDLKDRVIVAASGTFTPIVPLIDVFFPEDGLDINSVTGRTLIKDVGIQGTVFPTDTPAPTPTPVCPDLREITFEENILTLPIENVNPENVLENQYYLYSVKLDWPGPGPELQSITFGDIFTQTVRLPDMAPKYSLYPDDSDLASYIGYEYFIGYGYLDSASDGEMIFTFNPEELEKIQTGDLYKIFVQFARCDVDTVSYTVQPTPTPGP